MYRVDLEWLTAFEQGSSHFVVERSNDAQHWTDLLSISAIGESAHPTAYDAQDRSPLHGLSFYRLRMIDIDGSFKHSAIKQVDMRRPHAVAPNPARGAFTVFDVPAGASIDLIDALGRSIPIRTTTGPQEDAVLVDPMGAMPGVYLLRVAQPGHTTSLRLALER
ncbi:MAG: T9SS type A sorting domain-containing protein [Flavobacteriales bacterium]|nr:T9SS type A sorting domain-containing protein [Flavobacteriales bacterium]